MNVRIIRIIMLLFCVLVVFSGCGTQITVEDSLTEEYLKMPPKDYAGRDRNIRKLPVEELNVRLKAAFKIRNIPLMTYYVSIGANPYKSIRPTKEFVKEFIENNTKDDYFDFVKTMFDNGYDFMAWNAGLRPPKPLLHYCVDQMELKDLRRYLELCKDVDTPDRQGLTALMYLVWGTAYGGGIEYTAERYEKVQLLLERGASVTPVTKDGRNILHYFTWYPEDADCTEFLEYVVSEGVDVNFQNAKGGTPLHFAAYPYGLSSNSPAYIRFLLGHGADKTIPDNVGVIPFHMVSGYERGLKDLKPEQVEFVQQRIAELEALLNPESGLPENSPKAIASE